MFISKETCEGLNELLKMTFQLNAHADNCAYWLDFNSFVQTNEILHEKYAHKFPELADKISEFMSKMGCRAVRIGLEIEDKNYKDFEEVFQDISVKFNKYRSKVYDVIDIAEDFNDREVVNFLDDYLLSLSLYLKQIEIWLRKVKQYEGKPAKFDKDFKTFLII